MNPADDRHESAGWGARSRIAEHVWGDGRLPASDSAVAVLVLRLRRTLETGGERRLIQTVRGWGYVLRS